MLHDVQIVIRDRGRGESSVHLDGAKLEGVRRIEIVVEADDLPPLVRFELHPSNLQIDFDEAEVETREVVKIDLDPVFASQSAFTCVSYLSAGDTPGNHRPGYCVSCGVAKERHASPPTDSRPWEGQHG